MLRLGDQIGRGAYGAVYRGINLENGEFVAIKRMSRNAIEDETQVQMKEIDMLKKLRHPNVVEYYGFIRTHDSFYIVMEFCENGSLQSVCKKFGGGFPEPLVSRYIKQVLNGLHYLHEQGVVHRDIKGGNLLTTKDGVVKLADFGLAINLAEAEEASAGGSPYWMAPEVIDDNGLTTASDIWSVGCSIIELLTGKPPYGDLGPYTAMLHILKDDHPPIPTGITPALRDFLMETFQKDPNLRASARKLLAHRWLRHAEPNETNLSRNARRTSRTPSSTSFSEGVRSHFRPESPNESSGPTKQQVNRPAERDARESSRHVRAVDENASHGKRRSGAWGAKRAQEDLNKYFEPDNEEFGDIATEGFDGQQKLAPRHVPAAVFEDDFDQEFDDDSDERLSERFRATLHDLQQAIASDPPPETALKVLLDLAALFKTVPAIRASFAPGQIVIPMMDAIRSTTHLAANADLLTFLMDILDADASHQIALMGGLRVLIEVSLEASSRRSRALSAEAIVKMVSMTDSILRMFLACDGLSIIGKWLDARYGENRNLVRVATECLASILEFKGDTSAVRKAVIARLVKCGILETLSHVLHKLGVDRDAESMKYTQKLLELLVVFSQGDTAVREAVAETAVMSELLRELDNMPTMVCVTTAKVIKNVSSTAGAVDSLWRLDCTTKLIDMLRQCDGPFANEICNQVLPALFNLCRIDKSRQEAAAMAGIIPALKHAISIAGHVKEFAYSILADLAHAGKRTRELLWMHEGLNMYFSMLGVSGHEANALEAMVALAGPDPQRAAALACSQDNVERFGKAFGKLVGVHLENALTPSIKLLKLMPPFASKLCARRFDQLLLQHLQNRRAVVRLNVLKALVALQDADRDIPIIERTRSTVVGNCHSDPAVLVQEMVATYWK
ncbi:kinase-like domain-containing protein [Hyaloraphidium curvatum]|nr:kinase-like domain-containing protein [Hyaloraphidium curvatum]